MGLRKLPPSSTPEPEPQVLAVAAGGRVHGLDPQTGMIRWSAEVPGGREGAVDIAVAKGRVFVSAPGDRVLAIDAATGRTAWELGTGVTGRATMLIQGDRLVMHKGGRVLCFSFTGQRLWTTPLSASGASVALAIPGTVRVTDEPPPPPPMDM